MVEYRADFITATTLQPSKAPIGHSPEASSFTSGCLNAISSLSSQALSPTATKLADAPRRTDTS